MSTQTHVVAKSLVFNDKHQVLLLVRSDDDEHRPGGFDLPGGRVEDDEEYKAGAIREALEEAGLVLDPQQMELVHASAKCGYNTDAKTDINLVKLTFIARVPDSTVVLSHEHQDYGWYSFDDALATTDHETHRQILNHLRDSNIAVEYWS